VFGIFGPVVLSSASGPIGALALALVVLVVSGATGLVRFVQDATTIVG